MTDPAVLIEIVRSGFVEGHHRGSVVVLDADGKPLAALGDVDSPVFPRSCNKPIQVVGMLRAGLDLSGELLALAGASHSGETFHIDGVHRILAEAGLDESALQTPPDFPLDDEAMRAHLRAGGDRTPIAMNCSGKHAAMLATSVRNGWPVETYLEPDHPLQQALATTFAELTQEPIAVTGVDGCGAPLFATSLTGLARAFRALVVASEGSPERAVVDAFSAYPEYASGSTRDEATLLRGIPGAIGKAGAEACYALALPDGRAVALKVDDGHQRARPPVMAAVLQQLGVDLEAGVDGDAVRSTGQAPVLGGGRPVGELRPAFTLPLD